jgi:Single Cache domain 2
MWATQLPSSFVTLERACYAVAVVVTRLGVIANDIVSGVGWLKESVMSRNLMNLGAALLLVFVAASASAPAAQFGTEAEARAMLGKAVAALKENKEKALEMFNKGEGGFKDRDLYVFCANASDGVLTAHPYLKGEHLQDIVGKKGFPLGQEIMRTATEGEIKQVTYWWPRPGSETPLEKHTFFTKVGDQNCGVGYYKG